MIPGEGTQVRLAVVLPIFNEAPVITALAAAIEERVKQPLTLVFVDDGSTDRTRDVLKAYKPASPNHCKKIVVLSRNYGHHAAIMAGLATVPPDAGLIAVMDADFQDDPADLQTMKAKIDEGYDCVYTVRTANANLAVNIMTKAFYAIQRALVSFPVPQNSGTACLFNRSVLTKLLEFGESEIYFPGLRAYVGMRQAAVPVRRGKRADGRSRVGLLGLLNLAITGILGFTAVPMRLIFIFGLLLMLLCMSLGVVVLLLKLLGITQIAGVTTILIVIFGFFGIQIMFTGIVGEYVGKMFLESKRRPRWFVSEVIEEQ